MKPSIKNKKFLRPLQRIPSVKIMNEGLESQKEHQYNIYTESKSSIPSDQQSQKSSFALQIEQQQQDRQGLSKLLDKLGLNVNVKTKKKNEDLEMVVNTFVQNCIDTVDRKVNTDQYQTTFNDIYEEELKKQEASFSSIFISQLTELQKIQKMQDYGIILIIKNFRLLLKYISMICQLIIENPIFQGFILMVIVLNSIKMTMDDPLATESDLSWAQDIFTGIYVAEMVLKIFALGFLFNKGAYLRDLWNIMDFVIVVTSLLPMLMTLNFSISALRAVRVLRPLRTITKIKALKMIIRTLFHSFSLVVDSLYILLFIIFVFSIAGMQLFGGKLKNHCMVQVTGFMSDRLCNTDIDCQLGQMCVKGLSSPNFSLLNFDTFLWSFLNVFESITLQGWSDVMSSIQITNGYIYFIYSLLIVFICEYVILNMTMAILKYKYGQVKQNALEDQVQEKQQYEPQFLKKIGIYKDISVLSRPVPLARMKHPFKVQVGCQESLPFQKQQILSNQQMFNYILPTETIMELENENKDEIDFEELKKYGKTKDLKWDPNTLNFETNFQNDLEQPEEKQQQQKSQGKIKDIQEAEEEQYSFSEEFSSEQDDQQYQQDERVDRAQQVHQKLKKLSGTQKSIKGPSQKTIRNFAIKVPSQRHLKKKQVTKELSQLDHLLSLIGTKAGVKQNHINIEIPQVNFDNSMPNRIYQKFADLGDYKIKRVQKKNQLRDLNVPMKKNKKQKPKVIISALQANQEAVLDLTELHLKNNLQKKQLRCRLKKDDIIDKERTYDITRVIISQKMKQVQKKKQEIQQNLNSLNFNLKYKISKQKNDTKVATIFTRNIEAQKILLQIPEKIQQMQMIPLRSAQKQVEDPKQKNNFHYLRLLQKNHIEEKIELTYQKIMVKYFKKDRNQKQQRQPHNYQEEYQNIRQDDILKKHGYIELELPVYYQYSDRLISSINIKKEEYQINIRGLLGWVIVFRKKITIFASYSAYDNLMLIIVFLNTILMSMSGFVDTDVQPYKTINLVFTYIFTADLIIKVTAYGMSFFRDVMNLFDTAVVLISMLEIFIGSGGSNLTALRSIRILRAFRVLRITRMIRSLNYMKIVMGVVTSIITEFIYVFLLLFLFIFIYTLLGMQLFGGVLNASSVTGVRQNFDSFFNAFFSIFQVMTIQNWNEISKALAVSSPGPLSIVFLISFVFIGNWILLSLLQAILLDGFDDDATDPTKQIDQQDQHNQEQQDEEQQIGLQQKSKRQQEQQSLKQSNASSKDLKIKQDQQDYTFFLFAPQSWFRKACISICQSKLFEGFIFIAIVLSSLKLGVDTYIGQNEQSLLKEVSQLSDYVFNFIFIFEAFFKIISQGFIIGPRTYLKNSWNKLDFFIVIMSVFDMMLQSINLSIIKLLRTLRPLRILTRNQNMKIMVNSLIESLVGIFNVLIICLCVFLMFSILGMNLLQGKLNYCNLQGSELQVDYYGPYGVDKIACQAQGGVWAQQFINFQNIVNSMLSLYIFSTRQNWPYYVFTFIDGTQQGPVENSSQLIIFLYAVLFIFIGSLFFMDLLIGVMFMNYHEAEAKVRPKLLTDKQINWKNLQKVIVSQDPCFKLYLKPQNKIQQYFFNIVDSKYFQIFISLVIVLNIIIMSISNDEISQETESIYEKINSYCSYIFICELTFKLITFGRNYFLSTWNVFDFFVVSASILDIILEIAGASSEQNASLSTLPQIARIFRVLRITRLLRMFKQFKGLQKLIQTFVFSLPAIGKGLSLLLLYLFITSILASFLMGDIKSDFTGIFNSTFHYRDFHHAIELLYVNLTGQNWYYFMFFSTTPGYVKCMQEGVSCTSSLNYVFWLPFMFIGQKVILELFVLIVLDQFQANYINQNNPLGIFSLYQQDFRNNWIKITGKYNSTKIQTKRLIDLLLVLQPPLGLGRQQTLKKYKDELQENDKITQAEITEKLNQLDKKLRKSAARILHKMNIMKNRIYFGYHETFYHFTKLAHEKDYTEKATIEQLDILEDLHKESQAELQKVLPQGNIYYFQQLENGQTSNVPLNPISLILFTQMIMKSWYNYSLKTKSKNEKKKQKRQLYDSLNNSCASDVEQVKFQKLNIQKLGGRRQGVMQDRQGQQQKRCEFKPIPNMQAAYNQRKPTRNFSVQTRRKSRRTSTRRTKGALQIQKDLKMLRSSRNSVFRKQQ